MAVAIPVEPSYFQFDQQGVVFNMWYFAWFDEAMARFLGEAVSGGRQSKASCSSTA